jgi:hypothetical protein
MLKLPELTGSPVPCLTHALLATPTGTGKTVTLVEAALQLLQLGDGGPARGAPRLLLVAPQVRLPLCCCCCW